MRTIPIPMLRTKSQSMRLTTTIAILCATASANAATQCETLYDEHLKTDLHLSYREFDQTEGKGFRVLAGRGCASEAGDLIERYVATTGAKENSLLWHLAQMRAEHHNYPEAIRYARQVITRSEDFEKEPLRWNDYVLAVIAFLERDKAQLIEHRDKIASAKPSFFGNELNLKLVDSLVRNFDKDYLYAVSHIE